MQKMSAGKERSPQLYTPDQKLRRDNSVWTKVQAILAPLQFFVCFVSIVCVINYLYTGNGYFIATLSILFKTAILYLIMITGAIWEKEVFGQYLLAPSFFLGRYSKFLCNRFSYSLRIISDLEFNGC